jgi:hypothetical protein
MQTTSGETVDDFKMWARNCQDPAIRAQVETSG